MKKFIKKVYESSKENPIPAMSVGISSALLATNATNAAVNLKRSKVDRKYQEGQIKSMEDLTEALKEVNSNLPEKEKTSDKKSINLKKFLIFKQKNNSNIKDYTIKGANLGLGLGIASSGLLPRPGSVGKQGAKILPGWDSGIKGKVAKFYNGNDRAMNAALTALGTTAIGASLGFIMGAISDLVDFADKKNVNKRLLNDVIDDLKKIGFKEDQQFTTNPRTAEILKTKVCIGISRSADTLRLLVNVVNDNKLSRLSREITKNLPSMSTRLERASDKFNDINITTVSGQGNSTFISSIAEKFIRAGYEVLLTEVG